jgi:hypothetical protein
MMGRSGVILRRAGARHIVPSVRAVWRRLLRLRFRMFQAHRHNRLVLETVAGKPLLVLPQVLNPKLFRTGEFLAQALNPDLIPSR